MQQRMGLDYEVGRGLFGCWHFMALSDVGVGLFRGIISLMIYTASSEDV